jgi:hypothetical protein
VGATSLNYMENIEQQAGQAILETGIPFSLKVTEKLVVFKKFLWFKYGRHTEIKETTEHYTITPLKYGTLIYVSEIACEVPNFNEKETLLKIALENPAVYSQICRAIAIGVLNDKFLIKEKTDELTEKLIWHLDPSEGLNLWMGIVSKMQVDAFFFTINLIKGKNILETRDTGAENQSGELLEQLSKSTI